MDGSNSPVMLDAGTRWLLLRWVAIWCGRLVLVAFLVWFVAFAALLVLLRWVGESNPTTVFALYLPPLIWVLPGLFLWPPLLILRFRAACFLTALALPLVILGLGYRFNSVPELPEPKARPSHSLMVLTNNRGQNGGHSLRPFKNWIQPDLMLFQESSAPAASYLRDPSYAEFSHGQTVGEFTLISRFPIIKAESITRSSSVRSYRYGARFELDWNGKHIAIYNVHLPSPRGTLLAMRSGAFLYGLPIPSARWSARRQQISHFWIEHQDHALDLITRLQAETLPCVLAGDFNAPHLGTIHRHLTQQLTDTHQSAGSGFGFTFPGQTNNPLALGQPWLRLDYVFCNHNWHVLGSWTESDRPSQHRSVAALITLTHK
jgi:endonuclease/exonuclease/phosphatase (EEP) superfamily protein YafD